MPFAWTLHVVDFVPSVSELATDVDKLLTADHLSLVTLSLVPLQYHNPERPTHLQGNPLQR